MMAYNSQNPDQRKRSTDESMGTHKDQISEESINEKNKSKNKDENVAVEETPSC